MFPFECIRALVLLTQLLFLLFVQLCSEDSNKCIPLFYYCDGKIDCPQGSDEAGCACVEYGLVECGTSLCVPLSWACAGFHLCGSHHNLSCNLTVEESDNFCEGTDMWCVLNETCLAADKICDGTIDCNGGEDEANCTGMCLSFVNRQYVP